MAQQQADICIIGVETVYYLGKLFDITVSSDSGDTKSETSYYFCNNERVAQDTVTPAPPAVPPALPAEPAHEVLFFHTDHLGSASVMTDETGTPKQNLQYYPYGGTRVEQTDPSLNGEHVKHRFTGHERDFAIGIYYAQQRYYDQRLARFISPDPVGPDLADPQSLNPYAYCRNNPVKYVDPEGQLGWLFAAAGIGAALGAAVQMYSNYKNEVPLTQGLGRAMLAGAIVGVAASVGASIVTTQALGMGFVAGGWGVTLAAGAGAGAGGYAGGQMVESMDTGQPMQINPEHMTISAGAGAALAGGGRATMQVARKAVPWAQEFWKNGKQLPQDKNVNPAAPKAKPIDRPISKSSTQNAAMQEDIAAAKANGAKDFRVNQQQVNAEGKRVGVNRPDLQYTQANGIRKYIEYDTSKSTRGPAHAKRIRANDPKGTVEQKKKD